MNGTLIQELESMVIRAEQKVFLGPCCGFESYGMGNGENMVPCSGRATIHLLALEIQVCERCMKRGSY